MAITEEEKMCACAENWRIYLNEKEHSAYWKSFRMLEGLIKLLQETERRDKITVVNEGKRCYCDPKWLKE